MRRRVLAIKNSVWRLIVTEDAFGLKITQSAQDIRKTLSAGRFDRSLGLVGNTRFAFGTDADKVEGFNQWFQEQVDAGLLQVDGDTGKPWTSRYVDSSYRQGAVRSYTETNRPELTGNLDFYQGTKAQFLRDAFSQPEMVSKVKLLATRNFAQLKGIGAAMSTDISRILSDGISNGLGPRELARSLNKSIDAIGKKRALTMARTEVIHAHSEGQLDSFKFLGVEEVGIMAEWSTAGDDRVCPLCGPLGGTVMTVKEAQGLIPRHPNCRCAFVPANIGESTKGQKRGKRKRQEAFDESVGAGFGRDTSLAEARLRSAWPGADTRFLKLPKKLREPKISERIGAPASGLWGHQPTSVIRWMGKEGFNFKQAKRALEASGVDMKDATIRAQLSAGKKGLRGSPANLTPEQASRLRFRTARRDPGPAPPPKLPPLPKPVIPPKPLPPKPPVISPDKLVEGIKAKPKTRIIRWMGKEDFDFKQARAVLDDLGIDVKDSTIRAQLRAGKIGKRGAPASFTDAQSALLRDKKNRFRVDPSPRPKPKPEPPTPKPTPEPAAKSVSTAPEHLGFSGDNVTDFSKRVWGEVGDGLEDEVHARRVGKLFREEIQRDPRFVALEKNITKFEKIEADFIKKGALKELPAGASVKEAEVFNKSRKQFWLNRRRLENTQNNRSTLMTELMHEKLPEIRDIGGQRIKTFSAGDTPNEVNAKVFVQDASKKLPKTWMKDVDEFTELRVKAESRGYFFEGPLRLEGRTISELALNPTGPKLGPMSTSTHELVHAVEASNRRAGRLQRQFKLRRQAASAGEKGKLSRIYKGSEEWGFKDEFTEHYMGKNYSGKHHEILTMGVEGLYHNKFQLWAKDEDMVDFILGMLAGL